MAYCSCILRLRLRITQYMMPMAPTKMTARAKQTQSMIDFVSKPSSCVTEVFCFRA